MIDLLVSQPVIRNCLKEANSLQGVQPGGKARESLI